LLCTGIDEFLGGWKICPILLSRIGGNFRPKNRRKKKGEEKKGKEKRRRKGRGKKKEKGIFLFNLMNLKFGIKF